MAMSELTPVSHFCSRCGGELEMRGTSYVCRYCGSPYDIKKAEAQTKALNELFDDAKLELVRNLRRNLYDAVNAEFVSREDVKHVCDELKKYLPDDFAANFYRVTTTGDLRALNKAICEIDVEEHYNEIGTIVTYLLQSLTEDTDCLLALGHLVEQAYPKKDLLLYDRYATAISEQAERVMSGVYETKLPRDVFVAYSSKDMKYVLELVHHLEDQGFSCFVASRNLRHGVGSVEDYNRALKEAMDHCHSFVFLSSMNSRNSRCDALRVELEYIRSQDIARAPAQHFNNYTRIPHQYKKPRVEYRLEESKRPNAADRITEEFFDGYERVYTPAEVADRVFNQVFGREDTVAEKKPEPKAPDVESIVAKTLKELLSQRSLVDASTLARKSAPELQSKPELKQETKPEVKPAIKPEIVAAPPAPPKPAHELPTVKPESSPAPVQAPVAAPQPKPVLTPSAGLRYERSYNGKSVVVKGIGSCKDANVIIASRVNGMPVTEIAKEAFKECKNLRSIVIPQSVTAIGDWAFYGCSCLTSITLPPDVKRIGSYTFSECKSLTSVNFPSRLIRIEEFAFSACACLTNVVLPSGVTSLGSYAFAECGRLAEITLGARVSSLGKAVFSDCSSLKSMMYGGTKAQWNAINKDFMWCAHTPSYTIRCTDGTIHR